MLRYRIVANFNHIHYAVKVAYVFFAHTTVECSEVKALL